MIVIGLISILFLTFIGLRIAQNVKRKKSAYKGSEGRKRVAGGKLSMDGLKAAKAQTGPSLRQTVHTRKSAFDFIRAIDEVSGDAAVESDGSYAFNRVSISLKPSKIGIIGKQEGSGLERINRLPDLQKAVVWAELLGKPRSEKGPLI